MEVRGQTRVPGRFTWGKEPPVFNEPEAGGTRFGLDFWWIENLLLCLESNTESPSRSLFSTPMQYRNVY